MTNKELFIMKSNIKALTLYHSPSYSQQLIEKRSYQKALNLEKAALRLLNPFPRSILYRLPPDMIEDMVWEALETLNKTKKETTQLLTAAPITPLKSSFSLTEFLAQNPALLTQTLEEDPTSVKERLIEYILSMESLSSLDLIPDASRLLEADENRDNRELFEQEDALALRATFNAEDIERILIKHSHLNELKILSNNTGCIKPITTYGKDLSSLFLVGTDSIGGSFAPNPLHLENESFEMGSIGRGFNSAEIDRLTSSLPHLQELKMCGWNTDWSVTQTYLSRLTNLTSITLQPALHFGEEGVNNLSSLTQLANIELHASHLQNHHLSPLRGLRNLGTLKLVDPNFGDRGLQETISHLMQLTSLKLIGSHSFTDAGYASLASLTNLESLDLSESNITNQSLTHFASLPNLRTLILNDCSFITAAGFAYLRERLPNLDIQY